MKHIPYLPSNVHLQDNFLEEQKKQTKKKTAGKVRPLLFLSRSSKISQEFGSVPR